MEDGKPGVEPHVVIVGGGFGGLAAAKALANKPVKVTLIDRSNHHTFQPLLYQVATAGLSPADIAAPLRGILKDGINIEVILGLVTEIDTAQKSICMGEERIDYDFLILAAGASNNYFGNDQWEPLAPGLKSLEEATEIRRRILVAFEQAEQARSEEERLRLMTFVIIGGGPTGVEMAGAIAELSSRTLKSDFRRINPQDAKVHLLEGAERLLSAFDPSLSQRAKEDLERLGVEVHLKTFVKDINPRSVVAGDLKIATQTVIWAAGVKASGLGECLNVERDRGGRVPVKADLSLPLNPEVFVIGDMSKAMQEDGSMVPGVAQGALQGGQHAAKMILRTLKGQPREPFKYWDKGSMATIGRSQAVLEVGKLKMTGLPAWFAWMLVHIYFLVGFGNRVLVFMQWVWAYVFFYRGARLITHWKTGRSIPRLGSPWAPDGSPGADDTNTRQAQVEGEVEDYPGGDDPSKVA